MQGLLKHSRGTVGASGIRVATTGALCFVRCAQICRGKAPTEPLIDAEEFSEKAPLPGDVAQAPVPLIVCFKIRTL